MSYDQYLILNICVFWRPVCGQIIHFETSPQSRRGCQILFEAICLVYVNDLVYCALWSLLMSYSHYCKHGKLLLYYKLWIPSPHCYEPMTELFAYLSVSHHSWVVMEVDSTLIYILVGNSVPFGTFRYEICEIHHFVSQLATENFILAHFTTCKIFPNCSKVWSVFSSHRSTLDMMISSSQYPTHHNAF